MSSWHPSSEQLEQFVTCGASDAAFEHHVSACDACARRLAGEAQLELALIDVAASRRSNVISLMPRSLRGRGYLMGVTLAIAASMLMFFHAVSAMAKTPVGEVAAEYPTVAPVVLDGGSDGRVARLDGGRFGRQFAAPPCETCGPRD